MRFTTDILTPLTAFCLFGSSSDWAAQVKRSDQTIVEKATEAASVACTAFLAAHCNQQAEHPHLARLTKPSRGAQTSSPEFEEPTFLKRRFLFTPNGLKLSAPSRKALKCAAAWLHQHRESQLFIVGYCDASGSENCTAALEGRRGEIVRQFLVSLGVPPDQIAGVKGWDSLDQTCRVDTAKCQRLNRSVRLFVKGSAGMGVEPKEVKCLFR
jgi:outer membrane protein OmpA-like peptidoglycan-associated protein